MKTIKDNRKIGLILILGGIGLFLGIEVFLHYSLKPEIIGKRVQKTINCIESDVQTLIDQGLNLNEIENKGIGVFIFSNDSLTYWNSNELHPKHLKRRINIGHDTICSVPSGDYYFRTVKKDNTIYYLFKLLNSHYRIENQYFENGFKANSKIIDAQIQLKYDEGDFNIKNCDGKLLTKCRIIGKPKLKSPYKYIWYCPSIIFIIIGILLSFSRQKEQTKKKNSKLGIEKGIAIIVALAAIFTYAYHEVRTKKENTKMIEMAENLLNKRDKAFENSFKNFAETIVIDTNLREMLFSESNVLSDVILGYSKELLFDENMKAYTISLTLCEPNEEITIQPEEYVTDCEEYFLEKTTNNNQKKVEENLYFIDYYTFDPNYLGKIKIYSKDSIQQKTLYFEFYKPIAPEGFGFPQLLQENNSKRPYVYSVANYRNQILVYKYGRYIYPNFFSEQNGKNKDFNYADGYKHYTLKYSDNDALVISAPLKGWSEKTAPFAVFFLCMMIPYLLIFWILQPKETKKMRNFRQRLQLVVLSTLALSFLAIGPVSVIYMRSVYNKKTINAQFDTTRTLSLEMENDLDIMTMIASNTSRDTWANILQHYANTFFTDINLYRLDGMLIATTRPEINELNLQAPIMNAEAYQQMHRNKALYFTHEEYLGKGIYESSYTPMTDTEGNTLAYLNTPYFSSTTDLHKEIQNFVLTYINIILILLGIALVFVLSVTKKLTQPLSLIQNKLSDLKIDQKNEPIEWKGDDEIGALVKQYNQLIVELEKSAAELKRTAAESAWRGVARQVAHEIKNSLTPMRLSVQLLQRNIDNGKATPEQIQRTTNTLIEQIDALSDIASSFSRYAKLPENRPEPFDLAELVGNVVNLYDNAENVTFSYVYDKTKDHTYNGDKTNLNSAVGNLVKNALQAIGSKPNGKIEVTLKSMEFLFVITVKDNGKGIKDEDKDRIFLPNFTTKSGGSGVGLSLTYNIVQAAKGTISFESEESKGTMFVIKLPKS